MTAAGGTWLRQLASRPLPLQTTPGSDARAAGLPGTPRGWTFNGHRVPAPRDRAADRIRPTLDAISVGVPDAYVESLWEQLFSSDSPLREEIDLADGRVTIDGVPFEANNGQSMRRVLFGAVFVVPPDDAVEDAAEQRVTVLAELTVLVAEGRNTCVDAFLTVTTHLSTAGVQSELAGMPDSSLKAQPSLERVHIVVAADQVDYIEAHRFDLERIARASGVAPEFLLVRPSEAGAVQLTLTRQPTERALFIGQFPGNSLRDAFSRGRTRGNAVTLSHRGGDGGNRSDERLRQEFAEKMIYLGGMSAGMTLLPRPRPPLEPEKPDMPIDKPTRCLHDGAFIYVLDEVTKKWWTRDLDNHGDIQFKTYIERNRVLVHEAERDALGKKVPGKTKGHTRERIEMKTLHPCGTVDFEDHLRY